MRRVLKFTHKVTILVVFFTLCLIFWIINTLLSIILFKKREYRLWHFSTKIIVMITFKLALVKVKVEGLEHIPVETAIFAADHRSLTDTLAMFVVLKRYFFTLTAPLGYFPGLFFRTWIRRMGFISIFRDKNDEEKYRMAVLKSEAVFETVKRLKDGDSLVIYPEGHHEISHKVAKFHTGAVRFAIRADVPIIPVGITGTDVVVSRVKHKIHSGTIHIKFGRPIYYDKFKGEVKDHALVRRLTKELKEEVKDLLNQLK